MWENVDPASKTREIFFDNGDTLPARFNVDFKDTKEGEMIGDGLWGPVHKADWLGREVAVKKCNKTSQNVLLMAREVNRMLRLRHPNVLKLLGFYLLAQEDMYILKSTMIMELMDCDLDKYIAEKCSHGGLPFSNDESLYITSQIAAGMNHMHKLQYFHRDLKPQNVLVRKHSDTARFCADFKIADFGSSEFVGKFSTSSDRNVGTLWYKTPEQFDPSAKLLPEKVDVYSFAVLCSKILTGEEPYGGHLIGTLLKQHIKNGGKPMIPYQNLPGDFAVLIKECLDINPEARSVTR